MTFAYFERMYDLLKKVETEEADAIEKAVELMVDATEKKQSIFAFGASHAGILTQELFYRAGGMMTINPIFGKEVQLDVEPVTRTSHMERLVGYGTAIANQTSFSEGDVLIVHSVSGRNPVTIELAMEAQKKGVHTISITNLEYSKSVSSRHPSGKNLYEYSDVVIDNHGDVGDAACDIEGLEQKVGPSSTVIGATIVNTIVVETVQRLVERGMEKPPIFYSANLDGGDALNRELFEQYKDSIHYRF
ncbi:SIS domain-containing protein [Atopococcus tabaci]|uniref:SIS domain-containing protein n=1 Tax=Atopococcus tabaci TaxID=269774 RepID=UPI00240A4146|nr:SIS domain-containing protein [Atopococcus tabaci]